MRIAFAGVAHTHATSDALSAVEEATGPLAVWDADDPARLADFAGRFDPAVCGSLDELLGWRPDLVVVTARPHRVVPTVRAVLDAGVACFVNKVAAADTGSLAELSAAVTGREERFLTSSVLRFAPGLTRLRQELAGQQVRAVTVTVTHDVSAYFTDERRWQDDPRVGGGTAVSMGLHAWEVATCLLGSGLTPTGGVVSRWGSPTWSEDGAVLTAVSDAGALVSAVVLGAGEQELYRVGAVTSAGETSVDLGEGDARDSLGYRDCFRAAVQMVVTGRSPVPWSESHRVLETSILAAGQARSARASRGWPR